MTGLTAANIFTLCREGRESANKPNIHPRIRGRCLRMFTLIEEIEDYPKSEIEKDFDALKCLSYGQRTAEEKELIQKAYATLYQADRNAQRRNLKKAMNGEPPEDMDSEEEEDYGKDEKPRDLTAEEKEYLDSNRRPNIHPRILAICNTIFAELYRKPVVYMSRVKSMFNSLKMLRISSKTPEEKELVDRVSEAINKAYDYAGWRKLQRVKNPKEQDEEEETQAQNKDEWAEPEPFVEKDDLAQKYQAPLIDWAQEDVDLFKDNWAEPEPFDKVEETTGKIDNWAEDQDDSWTFPDMATEKNDASAKLSTDNWAQEDVDPFKDNWAEPEPFDEDEEAQDLHCGEPLTLDVLENMGPAQMQSIIEQLIEQHQWHTGLLLRNAETTVSDLTEQLEGSKTREEQLMKENGKLTRDKTALETKLQKANTLFDNEKYRSTRMFCLFNLVSHHYRLTLSPDAQKEYTQFEGAQLNAFNSITKKDEDAWKAALVQWKKFQDSQQKKSGMEVDQDVAQDQAQELASKVDKYERLLEEMEAKLKAQTEENGELKSKAVIQDAEHDKVISALKTMTNTTQALMVDLSRATSELQTSKLKMKEAELREAELQKEVKALKDKLQQSELAEQQPSGRGLLNAQDKIMEGVLREMLRYNTMLDDHEKRITELSNSKKKVEEEKLAEQQSQPTVTSGMTTWFRYTDPCNERNSPIYFD